MEMETKERIMQLITALGLSKAEFERVCGLSNGYINSIRNTIGSKGATLILDRFPNVNRSWLVLGEGEMFRTDGQVVAGNNNTAIQGNGNNLNSETAAFLSLLRKKDEQIDRLLDIIQNK